MKKETKNKMAEWIDKYYGAVFCVVAIFFGELSLALGFCSIGQAFLVSLISFFGFINFWHLLTIRGDMRERISTKNI
jgi:hypothetical protein